MKSRFGVLKRSLWKIYKFPLTLILSHQGRGKNKIELSHQGRFGRDLIYQVRKLVYRTDIGARPVSGFFITTAWAAARAEQGRLE